MRRLWESKKVDYETSNQWLNRNWVRRLFKDSFAHGVGVLAGGTALAQGIGLLASPVLTRLYTTEDFGYLQIYLSIMVFAVIVVTWRFELAVLLPEENETAANIVAVGIAVVLLTSTVFAVVALVLVGSTIFDKYAPGLAGCLWLIPLSACAAGIYQILSYWNLRSKHYQNLVATNIIQALGQVGAQLVLGFARIGFWGLLVGDAVGRSGGSIGLSRISWRRSRDLFGKVRFSQMWSAALRYRAFPLVSVGSGLLGTAGFALPMLIMGGFYGTQVLGLFALVQRSLGMPAILIGQAVSQVYSSEAPRMASTNPAELQSMFFNLMKKLALIGAIPYILVFMGGPWLFGFVFGEPWREAGVYARLLAAMQWMSFIAWPLTPTLNLLEEQGRQFWWDVGRLIFIVACLWLPYHLGLSARLAITAYGGAMFIGYVAHLFLSHRAIQRRIKLATVSGQPE